MGRRAGMEMRVKWSGGVVRVEWSGGMVRTEIRTTPFNNLHYFLILAKYYTMLL